MGKFDTPIRVAEGQIERLKQQISLSNKKLKFYPGYFNLF